ncbi:MAG: radical SAM protein [Bacteriovoracaceae bacterium]|nr:radical SAM protein [Bacteriovoracaceae bacterium]
MKILMYNPPFLKKYSRFSRSPAVTKSGTIYYPNWHAYATGVLEQNGHEVLLLDACAEDMTTKQCLTIIKAFAPQMSVVYTSTPSIYNDVEIAAELKEQLPNHFVVLTGPHVTALPKETLEINHNIDAIAHGEYDFTLVELAKFLEEKKEKEALGTVAGISFRFQNKVITTVPRAACEDLDSIPFVSKVYKKHLNVNNYFYGHCRFPVVSIFTSRGCSARCNYCVYPEQMFGRRHRQRSPENIVAEFEYIVKEMPEVKEILIDDDTFSFIPKHTDRVCDLLIEKKIKIPWTVECRATLRYETMVKMKKAGCRLIVVGFESADDQILKNIKKGITLEKMEKFVKDAKRAKIMLHSCFMAGNQGETKETLKKSLAFAKKIDADTCQFFPLMVYPGTPAYTWAKENNYLSTTDFKEWLTTEGLHNCVINTPELSATELVEFCDNARKQYYLNPRYITKKALQMVTSPKEITKTAKAAKTFFKYLLR